MLARSIPSGTITLKIHHPETVMRRRELESTRRRQQAAELAQAAQVRQQHHRAAAAAGAAAASMCVCNVAKTVHLDLDCRAIFDGTQRAKQQQQTSLRRDVERRQPSDLEDADLVCVCVCSILYLAYKTSSSYLIYCCKSYITKVQRRDTDEA